MGLSGGMSVTYEEVPLPMGTKPAAKLSCKTKSNHQSHNPSEYLQGTGATGLTLYLTTMMGKSPLVKGREKGKVLQSRTLYRLLLVKTSQY